MASELITGFAGKPHVGSDDMGAFQAGILGTGSYVLQTGQQLKATVASANKVTIGTGDLVMNGRHVRMATATDLTIQNGSQGKKRNDLIVCRYQKASDGKETATLTVVKGTATTGTPADPSYNKTSILDGATTSDMPLYRIPITNLSVGTPVQLFKVLTPLDTVGDSVTQLQPRVLFTGATKGDVRLSDDAANYDRLTVYYALDGIVYGSTEIEFPNHRWVSVSAVRINNGIFVAGINYYVNGRSLDRGDEAHTFGHANGQVYVSNSVDIAIVKVIGWR